MFNWISKILVLSFSFSLLMRGEDVQWFFYAIYFALFIFFLINAYILRYPIVVPGLLPLYMIFCLYSLLSVFWAADVSLVFEMSFRFLVVIAMLLFVYNVIFYYSVADYLVYGFGLGLLVNLFFLISGSGINEFGRFKGIAANGNELAVITLIALFFYTYLFFRKKTLYVYYYPVLVIGFLIILASGSRKGLVFGVLLLFFLMSYRFFFLRDWRKLSTYLKISTLIVVVSVFFPFFNGQVNHMIAFERVVSMFDYMIYGEGDLSVKWRLSFVDNGLSVFYDNIFFGVGLDNFKFFNFGYYAHNNYVELLADLGLIGFFFYYIIYIFLFFKSIKRPYSAFFVFYLIMMLGLDFGLVSYYERYIWLGFLLLYSYSLDRNDLFMSKCQNIEIA